MCMEERYLKLYNSIHVCVSKKITAFKSSYSGFWKSLQSSNPYNDPFYGKEGIY